MMDNNDTVNDSLTYAGVTRRSLAYSVDSFVLMLAVIPLRWLLEALGMPGGGAASVNGLMLFLPVCLYFSLFIASPLNTTVGGLVLGVRYTDYFGEHMGFVRALLRAMAVQAAIAVPLWFIKRGLAALESALPTAESLLYMLARPQLLQMHPIQIDLMPLWVSLAWWTVFFGGMMIHHEKAALYDLVFSTRVIRPPKS